MQAFRSAAVTRRLIATLASQHASKCPTLPLPPCRCYPMMHRSFSTKPEVQEAEVVSETSSSTTTATSTSASTIPETSNNNEPTEKDSDQPDFEKLLAEMKQRMSQESSTKVTSDSENGMDELDEEKETPFVEPPSNEVKKDDAEKLSFQAETRQILDIVANSLYTDKEVFLRELISNASDALEKARYEQSRNQTLVDAEKPLEIRITLNEQKNTITIQDHGIGMTAEELVSNLGTIARSGSKAFVKEMSAQGETPTNIIGQFGVGFYSAFMIADKVEVYSQSARTGTENTAHYWVSDGTGSYEISSAENVTRGSKIILHLKPACKEFAQKFIVEGIIKKYSNFVGFPIYLNNEKVNTVGAIWLADKSTVTPEQHTEFYRYVANAYDSPFYTLHFSSDAPISIHALFYLPERHMEKWGMGRLDPGVSLYSRKVLISPKSKDILPEWLRFVKGVVDCEDIPLNISRENMQDSKLIQQLNTVLTRRVLRFLDEQATKEPEKFTKWLQEFGTFIKEGICVDYKHRQDAAKLLRYETSKETTPISLDQYISNMDVKQKGIYYINAPNRALAEQSPYFEAFKNKGIEVLFLYDHIDAFVMQNLESYSKRKLISVEQANIDKDDKKDEKKDEAVQNQEKTLVEYIQNTLKDKVSKVTVTTRSISTPAIVVDHQSEAMHRLMKAANQGLANQPLPKQKLEINPSHPIMTKLYALRESKPELATLLAEQIFDNALIAAGILDDPRGMLGRINKIMEATQ